jgi:hypothetical protein
MSTFACKGRLQGPLAAAQKGPARAQQLLRQRPQGLASLASPAGALRSSPRRAALRTSAVATPEEPNYPFFSDERKEYSRKFARPVRARTPQRCRLTACWFAGLGKEPLWAACAYAYMPYPPPGV